MIDIAVTVLAIVGFAVAAAESLVLTVLAWLLSWSAMYKLGHERRIAALEAEVKQLRGDVDEADEVVDKALDVMGVSRNGVVRGQEERA